MKKFLYAIAAFVALFACTPINSDDQNNLEKLTFTGKALDITANSATLTGFANLPFELGDAEVGIMYDKNQSFENPTKVPATGLDGNNMFTVTVTGLSASTTYFYKSYVLHNGMAMKYGAVKYFKTEGSTEGSKETAAAVDLGIVITREDGSTYVLYWAECNLGASKPEDYGDYYAWGETEPKKGYRWSNYKWCKGSQTTLTKYNTDSSYGTVDNKTTLDLEDDAAHAKLGGKWRMPTSHEMLELITRCGWIATTQNGVDGAKVIGPNGNSIFLPGTDAPSSFAGSYWSSNLYPALPFKADFLSFYIAMIHIRDVDRCYGLSVRPVSE